MKQYIYLLCALFSICFYSCSNEEAALDSTSKRITVSFTLPGDDVSTRGGDVTTEATEAEKALNNIHLYCFDYKSSVKGTLKKIIYLTSGQIAEGGSTIDLEKGSYFIEAIANESVLGLNIGESTYADFLKLRANTGNYANWPENGLQMRGSQSAEINNSTTHLDISFTMLRLVARIDVVNNVPGLTINKATMANSVRESFYPEDETSIIAKEGGKTETRVAGDLSISSGSTACVFYTYEGDATESGLQISFEGTDNDGSLHKSLPIAEFSNQNAQPAIKRNKLYVVTLDEVDGAIKAEVAVKDWNQEAIDAEVTVEKDLDVEFTLPEGASLAEDPITGKKTIINVPATGCRLTFQTTSDNIEVEVVETPDVDWLTIAPATRALVQEFVMEVDENTAYATRSTTFAIRNKLIPSVAETYKVIQAAAEKPGPTFTEVSVPGAATLEQWADSKDAKGSNGKEFFMYAIKSPAVDTSLPLTDFDAKGGSWTSAGDPSENGYRMATKTDWEALAAISNKGTGYLKFNDTCYYISTNNKGYNNVKIVFQQCKEDGTLIDTQKTIEFGKKGSIRTSYKSTSPWNCTRVTLDNVSRYWCGGGTAFYVDLSYSVSVQSVSFGSNSSKGIGWYAMCIRSIKDN